MSCWSHQVVSRCSPHKLLACSALGCVQGPTRQKRQPAQLRYFDTARIFVQAGAGGRGSVAFRREANVPRGAPLLDSGARICSTLGAAQQSWTCTASQHAMQQLLGTHAAQQAGQGPPAGTSCSAGGRISSRMMSALPAGGPAGGNGGSGGHVWAEAKASLNSLSGFRQQLHFRCGPAAALAGADALSAATPQLHQVASDGTGQGAYSSAEAEAAWLAAPGQGRLQWLTWLGMCPAMRLTPCVNGCQPGLPNAAALGHGCGSRMRTLAVCSLRGSDRHLSRACRRQAGRQQQASGSRAALAHAADRCTVHAAGPSQACQARAAAATEPPARTAPSR